MHVTRLRDSHHEQPTRSLDRNLSTSIHVKKSGRRVLPHEKRGMSLLLPGEGRERSGRCCGRGLGERGRLSRVQPVGGSGAFTRTALLKIYQKMENDLRAEEKDEDSKEDEGDDEDTDDEKGEASGFWQQCKMQRLRVLGFGKWGLDLTMGERRSVEKDMDNEEVKSKGIRSCLILKSCYSNMTMW